jgi:hypothetical protein
MQTVSSEWLHERGGLHDARVIDVRATGSATEIALDDEWANSRGFSLPEGQEAPGTLVVEGISVAQGEPWEAAGGWISEVALRGDELDIMFCDRPQLTFRLGAAWWRSAD